MSRIVIPTFAPHPWGRTTNQLVFRTRKEQGEWAELSFALRAVTHGFAFAKAWGDSVPFDCIVINGGRLLRVQVKSTAHRREHGYQCLIAARSKGEKSMLQYGPEDTDFIAAYVIPEDAWFILPVDVSKKLTSSVHLSTRPGTKYHQYLEAWHQFGVPAQRRGSLVVPLMEVGKPTASLRMTNLACP